jgi:hypothetical protein
MLPPTYCSTAQTAAGYGQGAFGAAQGATTAGGVFAQQQAGAGYASQAQQQAQAQVIAGGCATQAQSASGISALCARSVLLHCCGRWAIDWRCISGILPRAAGGSILWGLQTQTGS